MTNFKARSADLDFGVLSRFVYLHWRALLVGGVLGMLLGGALAFLQQPVYRATTLLAPVAEPDAGASLGSALSNLGGLASMAGINISSDSAVEDYIAILRSRDFGIQFITEKDLAPLLFREDWNAARGEWLESQAPTIWEAWDRFNNEIRKVEVDRSTGHVSLSVEWHEPLVAADWANDLVRMVNERIRSDVVAEAQRSIQYLNEELASTAVVELEAAIFRLVESQVNRIMLANVRPEYAFRVLDPALPPDADDFVRPKRLMLILGGGILGGAILLVAIGLLVFIRLLRQSAAKRSPDT